MKKNTFIVISLVLFILITLPLSAAKFTGWCVKVPEGDMLMIWSNKKTLKVRLAGVDSPDEGQPFASEAREWMKSKVFKKKVSVEIQSFEGEAFLIGRVSLAGEDLSLLLLEAGMAWYDKKTGNDRSLSKAQKKARKEKVGLWTQAKPIPPWEIRAKEEKAKAETKKAEKKAT